MHAPASPAPPSTTRSRRSALGPAARWGLWLLVQALLALFMSQGLRTVAGPVHAHLSGSASAGDATADGASTAAIGTLGPAGRHLHPASDDAGVPLEPEALASEGFGASSGSGTGAGGGSSTPAPPPDAVVFALDAAGLGRMPVAQAERWRDADLAPSDEPPRPGR